jgi:hypothetical protein
MRKLVSSHSFDMFFALVVVSNSLFMGIEVVTWKVAAPSCSPWEGPHLGITTYVRVQSLHLPKMLGHLGRKQ